MEQQVIVLGMHRSGTSILSKTLINLGVNMGGGDSIGGFSNVEGHNEDYEMLKINESILSSLNSSWDNPPTIDKIKNIEMDIIQLYKEYVDNKNGIWGVKEPRLSLFANQINKVLKEPKFIYMSRDENEVAYSLNVRDKMDVENAKGLKKHYDNAIRNFLAGKDHLHISYSDLTKYPEVVLDKLCEFLNVEFNINAISHIKSKEQLHRIKKEKLLINIRLLVVKAIKDPKRIFNKNNIEIARVYMRRIKELFL